MASERARRVVSLLAVSAIAGGLWLLVHVAMERLSRWAEADERAYLWWEEEWLQLFTPANYVGRGRTRLMLAGPSEAREGLLPEVFDETFPSHDAYQNSLSVGTMEAFLVLMRYIEQVHGSSAMPDILVVGMTPRFILNKPDIERVPLIPAIDKYSPDVKVVHGEHPPSLAPKDLLERLASRYRLATHQPRRYRGALRAVRRAAYRIFEIEGQDDFDLSFKLRPSKFDHLPSRYRASWARVKPEKKLDWDMASAAPTIAAQLEELLAAARRHDIDLHVVNLPRGPWTFAYFRDGFYDEYMRVLKKTIGDTPFFDLRHFLTNEEYYDWNHATRAGAQRLSAAVAELVRQARERRGHDGH